MERVTVSATQRAAWLSLVAAAFLAYSLFDPLQRLPFAAMASLLLAVLAYSRASAHMLASVVADASVVREAREYVEENEEVEVHLSLVNASRVPVVARIADEPPPLLPSERRELRVVSPPRGSSRASYVVRARIGMHCFGEAVVEAVEPMGLFRVRTRTSPRGLECVRVEPRALERLPEALSRGLRERFGPGSVRVPGRGIKFYSLRDYQPGDEARMIEWKSTARTGRLMVRELERETRQLVAVLLVMDGDSLKGPPGETWFERLSRLAYSTVKEYSERGFESILVVVTPSRVLSSGPLSDRRFVDEARRLLASVQPPSGRVTGEDLARAVDAIGGRSVDSLVVIDATGSRGYIEGTLIPSVSPRIEALVVEPADGGLSVRPVRHQALEGVAR